MISKPKNIAEIRHRVDNEKVLQEGRRGILLTLCKKFFDILIVQVT